MRMDFRAKQAKSIPGSPAAVHTPPFTWEAEQADRFRGPLRRWQPLSSLLAGQGECPAHVAGMLGVQTRQHHGSTLLSVTPPPRPQHTMSCCLQGCSEFQLLPWDPGVGAGGAGRCGPAGFTCPPPSVYPSVIDPRPFGTSTCHSQTLGTL